MAPTSARVRRLDPQRLPRVRAAAQLLHRPISVRDPVDVARASAGIQAQDPYAARLSFRSRSRRLTAADVDRARTQERSLLRTWLMRMTIHIVPADDAGWLLPLFEPRIEKWSRTRLGQLGMPTRTQDKALRAVKRILAREAPLSRPEMVERLVAAGIELDSSTRLHIIGLAATSGAACLGPDRGRTTCLVRREDWLGKLPSFDRDKALRELARRYLGAFGPATERDFGYWSGLGLRDVRTGLGAIAKQLRESRLGEETLLELNGGRRRTPPAGQLRMLGAFDTYMLGYRSRDVAVAPEHRAAIKAEAGGGLLRPVIVRDGVVIGGWQYRRKGESVQISLDSPEFLSGREGKAIEKEVADLQRFEGVPVELTSDRAG